MPRPDVDVLASTAAPSARPALVDAGAVLASFCARDPEICAVGDEAAALAHLAAVAAAQQTLNALEREGASNPVTPRQPASTPTPEPALNPMFEAALAAAIGQSAIGQSAVGQAAGAGPVTLNRQPGR